MQNDARQYLKVEEVAQWFGVNRTTIYRLARQGRLPAIKVGGQWRFQRALLRVWESRQLDPGWLEDGEASGDG